MSRRTFTTRARAFAGCLAATLVVGACGASESSEGDRDRNVPIAPGAALFAKAVDGVARHKIADVSSSNVIGVIERRQLDGSHLIAIPTMVLDAEGARAEVRISRLDASGAFDRTFGRDGVVVVNVGIGVADSLGLGSNGVLVVALAPLTQDGTVQRLRRFNALTGQPDAAFGVKGVLDIPSTRLAWTNAVVVNDDGSVILVGRESDEFNATRFAERWTGAGRDMKFALDGRLELASPTYTDLGTNGSFSCNDPYMAPDYDGRLVALFGCNVYTTVTDENDITTTLQRRILFSRAFDYEGLGGKEVMTILDPVPLETAGNRSISISDVELGRDENLDKRYVIVATDIGLGRLTFSADYATFLSAENPSGEPFGVDIIGPNDNRPRQLAYANYVHGQTMRLVGVSANRVDGSTDVEVAQVMPGWANMIVGDQLRIGDFPSISHTPRTVSYVNSDVFINFRGTGRSGDGVLTPNLGNTAGYMKIGADGALVEPYGSATGMGKSPIDARPSPDGALAQPVLFPADDGSLHSVKLRWGIGEPGGATFGAQVIVTTFDPRGEKTGEKAIDIPDFAPFPPAEHHSVGFDGSDNFYVLGWRTLQAGVAKVSLSRLAVDASYGVDGFATMPMLSTGTSQFAVGYFSGRLQVNRDGSIDIFAAKFGRPTPDANTDTVPLILTSVRLTSAGSPDASMPEMVVTFLGWYLCECPADLRAFDIAEAAIVDRNGGLLVPMSGFSMFDENGQLVLPSQPTSFMTFDNGATFQQARVMCRCFRDPTTTGPVATADGRVVRYLRNGEVDKSFGVDGVGGASLLELGADIPLEQPRIALATDGNIFLVASGIEASLTEDDGWLENIRFDGEYAYAVMLNAKGLPINFTPRKPSEIGSVLGEVLRESRAEVAPDLPTTSPNVSEGIPAAVAAPAGVAASALLPSGIAQTTTAAAPVITIIGTPADRAIDVRWSVPESIAKGKASYTVTASPGGQKCTTATTSCVFKKLDPWTPYSFTITTVAAASTEVPASTPSIAVKPVRIVKRDTRTEPTKLITPASTGKQTWKATGGCKVTKDGKTFTTPKDAAVCTLSLTTAKSGKTPKTTRTITVVVRAVAK